MNNVFEWAESVPCAITVCDKEGIILFMNERSREVNAPGCDIIGQSLKDCHNSRSWEMIQHLIQTGETNSYTIEKRGQKKLIHQTPWYEKDASGQNVVAGLVEFSIVIPEEMPHFIRG